MSYLGMLAERDQALADCRAARGELRATVREVIGVYQAHPVQALAGAAGVGFVLAQLRVGGGLVRMGMRMASGPAWQLVRQYFSP